MVTKDLRTVCVADVYFESADVVTRTWKTSRNELKHVGNRNLLLEGFYLFTP